MQYELFNRGTFTQEQIIQINELREQGLSYEKIGKRLGKAKSTVIRAYKKYAGKKPVTQEERIRLLETQVELLLELIEEKKWTF